MKRNRVADLLLFMTNEERIDLTAYLIKHASDSQNKLYQLLDNRLAEEFEIADIFEDLYDEPYSIDKDYLIRNEFRHLGRHIEAFICGDKHKNQWDAALYLLRWLLDRGANNLFEIEWRRLRKKLQGLQYYTYLYQLNKLQQEFLRNNQPPSPQLFDSLLELSSENDYYLEQLSLEAGLENRLQQVFAMRSKKAYDPTFELILPKEPDDLDALVPNNRYLSYLWLKIKSYTTNGLEKVTVVQQLLELLPTLKHRLSVEQELLLERATLALEYFLHDMDEQALQHYALIIPNIKKMNQRLQMAVLFNYTTTLLRTRQYDVVIDLIDTHLREIEASNISERFYCIWSMCYLFQDDHEAAYQCLPAGFLRYSRHDHIYLRCILSIIFCEQGNLELAINEMRNLRQSQVYKREADDNIQMMIAYLQRYYKLKSEEIALSKDDPQKQQLYQEVDTAVTNNYSGRNNNLLPMLWLRDRLAK